MLSVAMMSCRERFFALMSRSMNSVVIMNLSFVLINCRERSLVMVRCRGRFIAVQLLGRSLRRSFATVRFLRRQTRGRRNGFRFRLRIRVSLGSARRPRWDRSLPGSARFGLVVFDQNVLRF